MSFNIIHVLVTMIRNRPYLIFLVKIYNKEQIFVQKVSKANLNFRYQPENIRKNIGTTFSSTLKIKIAIEPLIFRFFPCWYLQLGIFSQIVFVQKF